ncbi:hypothetical protein VTN00DRAFT_847 [Thermoascus crustaceus]|uniref:uncharacterized protein n=1 Tax=Thermoascus crustaceus TaxID=5088 RepID=UPI003742774F
MADLKTGLLSYKARGEEDVEEAGDGTRPTNSLRSQNSSLSRSSIEEIFDQARCFPALRRQGALVAMYLLLALLGGAFILSKVSGASSLERESCNTVDRGYQCYPETSHFWGQNSPYFSLGEVSEISPEIPADCRVTFTQILSRHGARYPTSKKTKLYSDIVTRIQQSAESFNGDFAFLKGYKYSLGADNLTAFGEDELTKSGIQFYNRYKTLARTIVPFVRASGSDRVVASGEKFLEGFQYAKMVDPSSNKGDSAPKISVVIDESDSSNNTLSHNGCVAFEDNKSTDSVQSAFLEGFTPAILDRFKAGLPGANLSLSDVTYIMDICAFETVAMTPDTNNLSPFCSLFTEKEWLQYDYYQSLGKYYGFGDGNPLGSTQGVGFVNELVARLTNAPVEDHTTVNHTLDSNPETFPLNATIYADFTHDNIMTSIHAALGLYNSTGKLSKTKMQSVVETKGYSAAWTVSFGARTYIEMMQCGSENEPLVRILVNDRVVPLHGCKVDSLGRCRRDDFVRGLSFARSGGNWASCSPDN